MIAVTTPARPRPLRRRAFPALLLLVSVALAQVASAQTASAAAPSPAAAPAAAEPAASAPPGSPAPGAAPAAPPAPDYTSRLLYTRQASPSVPPAAPAPAAAGASDDATAVPFPRERPLIRVPEASSEYLARMDRDGDGRIALGEYQDWLSYAFDQRDRNRDGVLDAGEQFGGRGETITRDAYRARIAERFRLQDRDRNGSLDARELAAPPQGR